MCQAYYHAFPCGHLIKVNVVNCYTNFTCKFPERQDVHPPVGLRCRQCAKSPTSMPDETKHEVSQDSVLSEQDLTDASLFIDSELECAIEALTELDKDADSAETCDLLSAFLRADGECKGVVEILTKLKETKLKEDAVSAEMCEQDASALEMEEASELEIASELGIASELAKVSELEKASQLEIASELAKVAELQKAFELETASETEEAFEVDEDCWDSTIVLDGRSF